MPEITSRIRRDDLLELLETEAPAPRQRTTAKMPAVTLTDLLCVRDDPGAPLDDAPIGPPPASARKKTVTTIPRMSARAIGTDASIAALEPARPTAEPPTLRTDELGPEQAEALASALEALMSAEHAVTTPLETSAAAAACADEPATFRMRRSKRASEAFDLPPLNAREIADVLDRLDAQERAEIAAAQLVAAVPPPSEQTAPPVPALPAAMVASPLQVVLAAQPPVRVAPVTTLQLPTLEVPWSRALVIAASCFATLTIALLLFSLL
jgi:hypothetical protein